MGMSVAHFVHCRVWRRFRSLVVGDDPGMGEGLYTSSSWDESMASLRLAAVIEVRPDPEGQAPGGLIKAAYRASCEGTVVLVLNGVSAAQVDRVLDSVVPEVREVAGVVYCTPATLEPLLQRSGWALG
jgi:hypothetical protein